MKPTHKALTTLIFSLIVASLFTYKVEAKTTKITLGDSTTDNGTLAAGSQVSLKAKSSKVKTIKYELNDADSWTTYTGAFSPELGENTLRWRGYNSDDDKIASGTETFTLAESTDALTSVKAKVSSDKKTITLSWKESKKVYKVEIYKKRKSEVSVKSKYLISTLEKGTKKYKDTDVAKKNTYYYKLVALDKNGTQLQIYSINASVSK